MVEAVYVGRLGRRLVQTEEVNFPNPAIMQQQLAQFGSVSPDCARLTIVDNKNIAQCTGGTTTNPIDPSGSPTGATVLLANMSNGLSESHEFQLTVDKRFSHGFTVRTAYTLSKTIDTLSGFRSRSGQSTNPQNYRQDRGLAEFATTPRILVHGLVHG